MIPLDLALVAAGVPPQAVDGTAQQVAGWARWLSSRHRVAVLPVGRDGAMPGAPAAGEPLDLVIGFHSARGGLAAVELQQERGVPAVVWVRSAEEYRVGAPATAEVGIPVWAAARAVLLQSEGQRAGLLTTLARLAPRLAPDLAGRLHVVPTGVELPPSPPAPGDGVLAIGRLVPQKGMDVLIEAVAGTGRTLTIAGDGPQRGPLERLAARRGIHCRFEGHVGRERLAALLARAGCVALASRDGEGLPNALLEAMAWGRPVVGSRVAGIADLVRDGVEGLLVPPGDPQALRAALTRVASDPALAARLGAAGRASAGGYTWERVGARLENVLERYARR